MALLALFAWAPPSHSQTPSPAPRQSARATGGALPYSVFVAAYQSWNDASAATCSLARRHRDVPFFVVPELVQGMTYWRVMAGMAADTSAAIALRERLVQAGVADEESVAGRYDLIQYRPLAFDLGEYPTAEQARARADSLTSRAIPTYVAIVPSADGTERWRVYAGAYRDTASSAPMRELLTGARIEPKLVERTGRPPASPK